MTGQHVRVEIYTVPGCGYCIRAKRLLEERGIAFAEHDVSVDDSALERVRSSTKRRTFPQIFIDGEEIGGCDDLHRLDADGTLTQMIAR
jgi:glutaredoxin 3